MALQFRSIHQQIKQDALDHGKLIKRKINDCDPYASVMPQAICGFNFIILKRDIMQWIVPSNLRQVVSLALFNQQSECLRLYANKRSLMCINVVRLTYTKLAFALRNLPGDPTHDALDFYINFEIEQIQNSKKAPNVQFSQLLHNLRNTGSEDYIFALARKLQLDVDLIKTANVVFRYTYPNSFGVLTALKHGPNWLVNSTRDFITVTH